MKYTSETILDGLQVPPARLISLVPSITDTLLTMGLGSRIIGITEYCPVPAENPSAVRVGGTKTTDLYAIQRLEPDLIIANQEENGRKAVEWLIEEGYEIWLTFPKTVAQVIADLQITARLFGIEKVWIPRIETFEKGYEWAMYSQQGQNKISYFCPIWMEGDGKGFMVFGHDTYANDLLSLCGGRNALYSQKVNPKENGTNENGASEDAAARYPHVSLEQILGAEPEVILFPDEPYPFTIAENSQLRGMFADTPAAFGRIRSISWMER